MQPEFNLDKQACAAAIEDPETPATVLHVIVLAAFGPDLYEGDEGAQMDPVDIWGALSDEFGVRISEEGENRLNALMTALSTDAFYTDPEAFSAIVMALSQGDIGDAIDGDLGTLTVPEMALAMWEVDLQREGTEQFDEAVKQLISSVIKGEAEEPLESEEGSDDVEGYVPVVQMTLKMHQQDILEGLVKIKAPEEMIAHIRNEINQNETETQNSDGAETPA